MITSTYERTGIVKVRNQLLLLSGYAPPGAGMPADRWWNRSRGCRIEAGFADQSHLTRHFKQAFGVTPGKWSALLVSAIPTAKADAPSRP